MSAGTLKTTFQLKGWNTNQLRARVPAILTVYGKVLDDELKDQIRLVQFPWPRRTYRKNGTIEGSPRDIVDLGGFLRSQRRNRPSATELRFTWTAPYASLILTGYTTNRGNVVPGRNWIAPALKAKPLDEFFAAYWQIYAKRSA